MIKLTFFNNLICRLGQMKCNPTHLLLADVGFPYVNPTYGVIKPRRHEGHEGRKKKISNFRLGR